MSWLQSRSNGCLDCLIEPLQTSQSQQTFYPGIMRNMTSHTQASIKLIAIYLIAIVAPSHVKADLIKLDNNVGFESVYLMKDPDASVVTVALTVLAGEVDVEGAEGLAHYLEHLMFWHADEGGDKQMHARGGGAWVNGYVTSYINEGEKSDLDDMFGFVGRLFEPPNLDKDFMLRERSVVAREYDYRVSENPDWRISTDLRRDLYSNFAVSRSVIGTPESIHSLTLAQAVKFHKRFYHPSNSVLYISGNLAKEEVEAAVKSHFGDIAPGSRQIAQWRNARLTDKSDTLKQFTDSQVNYDRLQYFTLSEWPNSQHAADNLYTLWMLQSVLDSALEGGIARPLRMDNFILRSFDLDLNSFLSNYFELTLFAEPDNGVSLDQASKAISETLSALASTGIPQATFDRVQSRIMQTENRKKNSHNSNYDRMSVQLSAGLSPVTFNQHLKHIEKISFKEVNELLRALADPLRRSVAHITPNGE